MDPPTDPKTPAAKVCLIGEERVGKTSLIRKFVTGSYHDDYLRTIGAVVSKRAVTLPPERGVPVTMNLLVYDIMGRKVFADLLGEAYVAKAQGALAVFDVTRTATMHALEEWVQRVRTLVGPVPLVVLANKVDLVDQRLVDPATVGTFAGSVGAIPFETSAKTGQNVEIAFLTLAHRVRERQIERGAS